jgi:hypothetical protein
MLAYRRGFVKYPFKYSKTKISGLHIGVYFKRSFLRNKKPTQKHPQTPIKSFSKLTPKSNYPLTNLNDRNLSINSGIIVNRWI